MGLMHRSAPLTRMLTQSTFDLGPVFLPATGAQDIAQGEQGIDMFFGPVHAWAFQAGMHHQFVATLHHATADRPTLRLKEWILQLGFAFFQVRQIAGERFCRGMGAV